MTNDEQLQERLAATATLAPAAAGLAAASRRRAANARRRRTAAAVLGVTAVAAGSGALLTRTQADTSRLVPPATSAAGECDVAAVQRAGAAYVAVIHAVLDGLPRVGHLYVSTSLISGPEGGTGDHAQGRMTREVQTCLARLAHDLPPIAFVSGYDDPQIPQAKGPGSITNVQDGTVITLSAVPRTGSEVEVSASQNTGGGFGYSGGRYRIRIDDTEATVIEQLSTWIS